MRGSGICLFVANVARFAIWQIGDFGDAYEVMKPKYQDDEYGSMATIKAGNHR